jgi:maleate cis-trans isomerase
MIISSYTNKMEAHEPESKAVFISCLARHTIEVIEKLECDLLKAKVGVYHVGGVNLP